MYKKTTYQFQIKFIADDYLHMNKTWKGINRKQSTRWQHQSRLKASASFSLQKNFSCYETQQLIVGTGTAIWWVTEPHCNYLQTHLHLIQTNKSYLNTHV